MQQTKKLKPHPGIEYISTPLLYIEAISGIYFLTRKASILGSPNFAVSLYKLSLE